LEEILRLEGISKTFPGVKALQNVSVSINKGEVHAIMGENGAGKSTLMKIVAGLYKPDTGDIILKNQKVQINNARDAIKLGISMIHQELMPIPDMTVAENIFLGREPTFKGTFIYSRKEICKMAIELFKQMEISIEPKARMKDLSVAETQLVEIAKALSFKSDIVIMDEPTSAITDREVEKLFKLIRRLQNSGVSIIYISHKMDEIFQISDRITVLRDGQLIGSNKASELNKDLLISMMVGRELSSIYPKLPTTFGEIVLEVRNLTKSKLFENISFFVRKGEILGISGLMGAGRTELVETIFGLRKADSGEVIIRGKKVRINNSKDAISNRIALVPEDRKGTGLNLIASINDNIALPNLNMFSTFGVIQKGSERKFVEKQINALKVKTPSRNHEVSSLSGGNQQKVVIGKWLLSNPEILILDEPTRGIDVGAKAEIHSLVSKLALEGKAVIMISSELPEIIGMSDRVIVLSEGKLTGEFCREEITQEKVMNCATGHFKGDEIA
jgi:inositol transport system ATP-binding protein